MSQKSSTKTVLVTGATGNQGGAVTEALLRKGMHVRALVRNPDSEKAKALSLRGVELFKGDLNDGGSIERAATNIDAAFVVTTPFAPGIGVQKEIEQGRIIIDALKRAHVPHVVYSSVSDADKETGVPHFESKADTERYLKASGLTYTITAPVFFSENFLFPWNVQDLRSGRFRQALPATRKLQLVSLKDIGNFNAEVIERGVSLAGRRINYAGDELSPAEISQILARASGRSINYVEQPMPEVRAMSEDLALMYEWFDRVGYTANVSGLREEFPDVGWSTLQDWAQEQNWDQLLA